MGQVVRVGSLGPNHKPTWRSADQVAPTVQTSPHGHTGPNGERAGGWLEVRPGSAVTSASSKPPYRVPSMAEIRALPWNGFTAASTFSGCGGSSLGYRMAGFRVAWASEFVPAARDVYLANASPGTIVDSRDIRTVSVAEVLVALRMKPGELDLLDGSPPCSSFSTAGKRSAGWGQVNKYSDTEQRSDDLFFEFARLVTGIQPKVFVAENVSGLVKGSAKGYFKEFMRALKGAGYRVQARLLDAQWLGVPQARQRIILIGVRDDLKLDPVHPSPLSYRYSVRDALPWVIAQGDNGGFGGGAMRATTLPSPTIGAGPATGNNRFPPSKIVALNTKKGFRSADEPAPTVQTHGRAFTESELTAVVASSNTGPSEQRKFTIEELRRICGFPDDFILTGTYAQQWERLGRAVPPVMMAAVATTIRDQILNKIPGRSGL